MHLSHFHLTGTPLLQLPVLLLLLVSLLPVPLLLTLLSLAELLLAQRGGEGGDGDNMDFAPHAMRVVNVASGMAGTCKMLSCLPPPVFDEGGAHSVRGAAQHHDVRAGMVLARLSYSYSRAKLCNVLHAQELPRRHAAVSALSVPLGWVETSIQSWMKWGGSGLGMGSIYLMRSGAVGVLPIVKALTMEVRTMPLLLLLLLCSC